MTVLDIPAGHTVLACGCVVESGPGEYARCPDGHEQVRPDHLTRSKRGS